jgi:hypothetical protein
VSAGSAAFVQSALVSQRQIINKLRQTQASGRIVLDLAPGSSRIDELPDLPLENGDRFFIPCRPSTVNVVGTVYNQSSFLYAENFVLENYLKQAGGPTRYADRSHTFVIRADGSVVSRQSRNGHFHHNIESLVMYPGDTVVVPAYVNKTLFLRGLMDWTQVFSSVGIGAAAVNVLR